jgi:intergrase/recombinase
MLEPRAGFDPATYGLQEQRRQTVNSNIGIYHLYIDDTAYYRASLTHLRPILAAFPRRLFDGVMQLPAVHDVDWDGFRRWLFARFSYAHAVDVFTYARKYAHLLWQRLAEVEGLPAKRHILMALSNLSKYLGCYRQFKMMLEDSGVSWSSGSKSNNFMSVLGGEDVNAAFDYYRRIMTADVDEDLKRLTRFLLLSGLRPCEGYLAVRFLNEGRSGYLDEARMLLCHWKFPEFQRNGKRCFLTVLTKDMMDDLKRPWTIWEWNHKKVRRRLHRVGLPVRLYLFRKAFGTYLRMNGIPLEAINLVQGRTTPTSVFEAHYFRPVLDDIIARIRTVLEKMEQELFLAVKGLQKFE